MGPSLRVRRKARVVVHVVHQRNSLRSTWFREIEEMFTKVGTEACIPRRCSHQIHRSNFSSKTPSQYFRHCISVLLLNHLISEMNSRISQHQQTAVLDMSIVPAAVITLMAEECCSKIYALADLYHDDLPSPDCLESKLHCWHI